MFKGCVQLQIVASVSSNIRIDLLCEAPFYIPMCVALLPFAVWPNNIQKKDDVK